MSKTSKTSSRAFPAPTRPAGAFPGFYVAAPPTGATGAIADQHELERTLVRAFLENIPDAVYFKDRESRFIAVSASLARKHNLDHPDPMIGHTDADFYSGEHAAAALEDEREILKTGQPIIGKLEKETWNDGAISWVLTSKMPLRNDAGDIVGTFGLSKDVTEQKRVESELETTHRQLFDASRSAGMAEVATGVLHNVGNVLNSVNVSATLIAETVRQSKAANLAKAAELLQTHRADLAEFLTNDPKGQRLPDYLSSLAEHLTAERHRLAKELEQLRQNIEHIKDIVSMQQSYATVSGIVEEHRMADLVEDSLRMNTAALVRHDVRVLRDFHDVPPVLCEKPKVLQILINLIRNAKYALDESGRSDRLLTLRIEADSERPVVRVTVQDNGMGIMAENLPHIFDHGFTTKKAGHGFGLHSSFLAAKDMGGSLSAYSYGEDQGATFVLELPAAPPGEETPG